VAKTPAGTRQITICDSLIKELLALGKGLLFPEALASTISRADNPAMVSERIRASSGNGFVTEELGLGIKCCEVALSSASARTWDRKIKNAQKAHDTAQRFVHRFKLCEREAQRMNQRIIHLRTLLEELK
jgi:hypothetical protein